MEARPLPPCPNLEQYKKQAKDLLKACASAGPGCYSCVGRTMVRGMRGPMGRN